MLLLICKHVRVWYCMNSVASQAATLTGVINGVGCIGGVLQGLWAGVMMDYGWSYYLYTLTGFYVIALIIPFGIH
jgi:hypothetical protein